MAAVAGGTAAPTGDLALTILGRRTPEPHAATLRDVLAFGLPNRAQPEPVQRWKVANLPNLWRGARRVAAARALRLPHFYGELWLKVIPQDGPVLDLGLVSMRVVTNNGVGFIVDAFQNLVELENMKFHGLGTGSTAEAAGDSALVTELTTEYTGDVRATGTTTEAASNIFQTVATNTLDGTPGAALREHGIFSQAATGGGVLLDRTVFAAITLSSGEALQSTYNFTITAGS